MKKLATLIILTVLCTLNAGMAFADTDVSPLPKPVLISANETPVLISANDKPVLISEKAEYTWHIDGNWGILKNTPMMENGSLLLPLRELAEGIGFSIEWNGEERSVTLEKGDFASKIFIGSRNFTAEGSNGKLHSSPLLVNGQTFLAETDMEKILGLFITAENSDLFLNTCDVEVIGRSAESLEDWIEENRSAKGTYVKAMDGFSYIMIVEEEVSTGGYAFDFSNIEVDGKTLHAEYKMLPPSGMATQALEKPYILLKVAAEISQVDADCYNYTGTVTDLKFGEHGATLYLDGGNPEERFDDLVVKVSMDTAIEGGSFADFKIGTVLDIKYTISTRSLPAQTSPEKIRVIEKPQVFSTYKGKVKEVAEDEKGYSLLLSRGKDYTDNLVVHIAKGSFMESEMYELDGKTVTVEYTICTMSLPPQTSPIKLVVER